MPEEGGTPLERLVPGVRVAGILQGAAVEAVAVRWRGRNFLTLTYRDQNGVTGEVVLGRFDEPRLRLQAAGRSHAFDGDGQEWRLAAEALRIRNAALFDPMLAVTSSNLTPLPHQITAVYREMLPRTPLRFLLADDPGAGKTIMAGLYIKELMLRGDLARCLVVAPGSLVEQWQEELLDKFGLGFELLTRSLVEATIGTTVFERHPLLIARMDHLARNPDLLAQLEGTDWDLVVVDEAHRMSARYYGAELKYTKRYQLGQLLGRLTRHLLLMTATPHSGKQDEFELFLALLDGDRFEGRHRDAVHTADPSDLMRRMIKEDLLDMDGRPLFPERRAYTVPYDLSEGEKDLYEAVTQYVREQMSRADTLAEAGERRRGTTVGFALTILQRRLASSPEAILRSLERRRERLRRHRQTLADAALSEERSLARRLDELLGRSAVDVDDQLEELSGEEQERLEDEVVDAATAAQTVAELDKEIAILGDLVELASRVRASGTDRKWSELRRLLREHDLFRDANGHLRKIVIFTEHRDTLNYLAERIGEVVGHPGAVVRIHGGLPREVRRRARELFTHDKSVRVLVATDAAGEGLNLQRAHLMINYDLPWNPNRIEQRFGRIHRIGQTEVCHLWNLVARNTREGEVYLRLLTKLEQQARAYQGKVFDVLGRAFENHSLRDLLVEAVRYGDDPKVRARLYTQIDATVGEGLDRLIQERALHRDILASVEVDRLRDRLSEGRARHLQPYALEAFFATAFARLGGRIVRREPGRYEITHVPPLVRERDRQRGTGAVVLPRYERVTFDRSHVTSDGVVRVELLTPGHPLVGAVASLTIEYYQATLKQGAILVDRGDPGTTPRLLVALTQDIQDGHPQPRTVSRRFDFVELTSDRAVRAAGPTPYLDYEVPTEEEARLLSGAVEQMSFTEGWEELALTWCIEESLPRHLEEVSRQVLPRISRTRDAVRERLTVEIRKEDERYAELRDLEAAGQQVNVRPETAYRRARELEHRLKQRMQELDADALLSPRPPTIAGGALVVPQGLLDRLSGSPSPGGDGDGTSMRRDAVEVVLAVERSLGRSPEVPKD
ncbi:MAG TPA: helicase-related protein, partial [Micromonosporaceae bacterium]|nr:helicase-related protein [Micromonosporaceae bacterium]